MRFKSLLKSVKTVVGVVLGLAVLVLIIAWLSGAFGEKISPGEVDSAKKFTGDLATDEVHEIVQDYTAESVGKLKAASRSVISAKVLATIEEITVTAGNQVAAGDVLVRLDDQAYAVRVLQAKEAFEAAKATRTVAAQTFERVKSLLKDKAVSQQHYDDAMSALEVAKAEERKAAQAVAEAEVLASYTTITAPKSGRIIDRLAEPGDTARPGVPLLVLYDATSLRLEAPVEEQLAVKLKVGQAVKVYVDSLKQEYDASIGEIVPEADAMSRSFLVKASLPRSENLYEGMFGRLRIPAGQRRHLCLATAAIQRVGQLEFVEVVLPNKEIERRSITTGRRGIPGRIEVLSGLEAGERVILRGGD